MTSDWVQFPKTLIFSLCRNMAETDKAHRETELVKLNSSQSTSDDEIGSEEQERLRLLAVRKKQELKLVKKFDKAKINVSKECWFLIDSDWLNKWSTFVNGDENEDCPGVLSTKGEPLHVCPVNIRA